MPRNALIKQYQSLFEIEGVTLQLTEGAVKAVTRRAAEMKFGGGRSEQSLRMSCWT